MEHPYHTLQLHPHAPQDLIGEAYWRLVALARADTSSQSAAYARIRELNDAYGLLMDERRRRAYDDAHGLRAGPAPAIEVRRSMFGRRIMRPKLLRGDYYRLLCVDPEATVEVIDTAYAILRRGTVGMRPRDVVMHQLLREAHETLRDPGRRAAYDARLPRQMDTRRNGHGATPAASRLEVRKPTDATMPPVDPEPETLPPSPVPLAPVVAEPETWLSVDDEKVAPGASWWEGEGEEYDQPSAFTSIDIRSASPSEPDTGDAEDATREGRRFDARRAIRDGFERVRALVDRVRGMRSEHREVVEQELLLREEEQTRLLELKVDEVSEPAADDNKVTSAEDETLEEGTPAAAELVFTAGPQAGARFPLTAYAVMMGSRPDMDIPLSLGGAEIAAAHASIWQHGDEFVFRQLDGGATTIDGQPLSMPLVLLEDGDEIAVGPHVMRFRRLVGTHQASQALAKMSDLTQTA